VNALHFATWLSIASTFLSVTVAAYTFWYSSNRRRVSVLVHRAFFIRQEGPSQPFYFIKVINLSRGDVGITHVWFATDPPVDVLLAERPLPTRLEPNQTWEAWVDATKLLDTPDVERSGRVRLANGRIIKSQSNKDVPPVGFVGGPGTH
jgi:hypothetical protein